MNTRISDEDAAVIKAKFDIARLVCYHNSGVTYEGIRAEDINRASLPDAAFHKYNIEASHIDVLFAQEYLAKDRSITDAGVLAAVQFYQFLIETAQTAGSEPGLETLYFALGHSDDFEAFLEEHNPSMFRNKRCDNDDDDDRL